MAPVVGPIAGAVGSFVGGLFSSAGAGILAAKATAFALTYIAPSFILSAVSRALAPKMGAGALNTGSPLQLSRGSDDPRRVIYGETRVAGTMVDAYVSGTNNEFLHLIVGQAGHECEAIGNIWFNDEVVPIDGTGNATGTYAGLARLKKFLGAAGQTADSDFVSESSGARSITDKFTSIAGLYVRLKWDQNKTASWPPNITALVKGRKCYDPRTATTVWTDNPAICVRDYLTNTDYGLAVDSTELDDATFIAAANACDELVALLAGGTEKRYRCNGSFERSEALEPGVVLDKLVETMAGTLAYIGGKWECHAGVWETPTITLDEDDLRGPIDVQTDLSLSETCNRVRGRFTSPDENYQQVDFTPIVNSTYLSEDGGLEIWHDLDLAFVTSQSQAQRLAKIVLEQTRQGITVRMPCKLSALQVKAGSVVLVNNAECGWTAKPFRVQRLQFAPKITEEEVTLDVDLFLRETASANFDWNNGEETTYDPAANTSLRNSLTVPTPTGLSLAVASAGERTALPRIKVTWNLPADQFVTSGGWTVIEFKKNSDSTWLEWSRVKGSVTLDYINDLEVGTNTDVRLKHINNAGVESDYCATVSLVAQAGQGNYTITLTNFRHLVRCNAEGTAFSGELGLGGRATTDVKAWAGATALTPVASSPITGQFTASAALIEGTSTFTKVAVDTFRLDTLGSDRTVVRITFDLEGLDTRTEDWILWKNTDGGAYWMLASAYAANRSLAGAHTPSTVTFSAKAILSLAGIGDYAGRFKIATWGGSSWTDVYTSVADEVSKAYTVPGGVSKFRCQLYKAGGFSTFLDEIEVPITNDGATGPAGEDGTDGATVLGTVGGASTINGTTPQAVAALSVTPTVPAGTRLVTYRVEISNASGSTNTLYAQIYAAGVPIGNQIEFLNVPAGEVRHATWVATETSSAGSRNYQVYAWGSIAGDIAAAGELITQ